jgi:hypothetical protein
MWKPGIFAYRSSDIKDASSEIDVIFVPDGERKLMNNCWRTYMLGEKTQFQSANRRNFAQKRHFQTPI